jgi:preprotein translocase subunit SecG
MFTTLIVFQVLLAAGLIAIVLVQRGPGATMGAAFGSGASGTVFGSRGAGNFLTRTTGWLAVGFFGISLTLAVLATSVSTPDESDSALSGSVVEEQAAEQEQPDTGAAIDSALERLDQQAGADEAGGDAESQPDDGGEPAAGGADNAAAGDSGEDGATEPPSNN